MVEFVHGCPNLHVVHWKIFNWYGFIQYRSCVVFLTKLNYEINDGFIYLTTSGVGIGSLSLAAPVYLSEIAQPEIRGCMGAVFQVVVKFGILFT